MDCPMMIANMLSKLGWEFDSGCAMWRKDLFGGIRTLPTTWQNAVEQELTVHIETRRIIDAGGVHYAGC